MAELGDESSWAHFEVIARRGWFENLLYRKQPWVEVALVDQESLQRNPGVAKAKRAEMPTIPENWLKTVKGLWTLPLADVEVLIDRTDKCLAGVWATRTIEFLGGLKDYETA